jgi:hypothetical protein
LEDRDEDVRKKRKRYEEMVFATASMRRCTTTTIVQRVWKAEDARLFFRQYSIPYREQEYIVDSLDGTERTVKGSQEKFPLHLGTISIFSKVLQLRGSNCTNFQ